MGDFEYIHVEKEDGNNTDHRITRLHEILGLDKNPQDTVGMLVMDQYQFVMNNVRDMSLSQLACALLLSEEDREKLKTIESNDLLRAMIRDSKNMDQLPKHISAMLVLMSVFHQALPPAPEISGALHKQLTDFMERPSSGEENICMKYFSATNTVNITASLTILIDSIHTFGELEREADTDNEELQKELNGRRRELYTTALYLWDKLFDLADHIRDEEFLSNLEAFCVVAALFSAWKTVANTLRARCVEIRDSTEQYTTYIARELKNILTEVTTKQQAISRLEPWVGMVVVYNNESLHDIAPRAIKELFPKEFSSVPPTEMGGLVKKTMMAILDMMAQDKELGDALEQVLMQNADDSDIKHIPQPQRNFLDKWIAREDISVSEKLLGCMLTLGA